MSGRQALRYLASGSRERGRTRLVVAAFVAFWRIRQNAFWRFLASDRMEDAFAA